MINELKKYILPNEKVSDKKEYEHLKHHFFSLSIQEIELINNELKIPLELINFYKNVGYGFFFQENKDSFDRFLDVFSFKQINLREDFYEFDPDLELYDDEFYQDKLIFFEVNEGVYLLLNKEDIEGKNAIYYFRDKIADSLEEFLSRFDKEGHYFEQS